MIELLKVAQVAAELQCSEQFVREELRRKNLRGSKLGEGDKVGWRISRDDLTAYVEAQANVSAVRKATA